MEKKKKKKDTKREDILYGGPKLDRQFSVV